MRTLIESLAERYRRFRDDPKRVNPSVRAEAAHQIMFWDAVAHRGLVTRGGLDLANRVLDGEVSIPGRER